MAEMVKLFVNGQEVEVEAGKNLIDALAVVGIEIPHFCYHPALGSVGACRVCAVKFLEGPINGIQMSCMVDAQDGMIDMSDYLSGASGFFPVPIIITEPAVGVGIGAAVARALERAVRFGRFRADQFHVVTAIIGIGTHGRGPVRVGDHELKQRHRGGLVRIQLRRCDTGNVKSVQVETVRDVLVLFDQECEYRSLGFLFPEHGETRFFFLFGPFLVIGDRERAHPETVVRQQVVHAVGQHLQDVVLPET